MTRERWARFEPFVDAALVLAPEVRRTYFNQVASAEGADFGAELERLVMECDRDDVSLDTSAAARFALLFDDESSSAGDGDIMLQLQTSLGEAYRLERELGGGGMSRVFLAEELGLARKVCIKTLAPELAAGISVERFEREIKVAASLQQANIVPLLAAGVAAGFPYYTMPHVDGRSLRDRLAEDGALPIGAAVSVLRDVARALAYAHERGVVHRDIKPGNVLLSGDTAVVTDFGIAKALGAARGTPGMEAITQTGIGIGTPTYMAPEQAAGDPAVDHRADIYAFGCLAYELFTGKPPFHGEPSHRIIAAHFRDTPRPVAEGRSDIPPAIASLIAQCLEKDPGHRPQSARELLQRLDAVATQPGVQSPRPSRMSRVALGALAFVVVAVIAYSARRAQAGGNRNPSERFAFAVLPFANLARDTALEYRVDGISDEILTAMGKVPGIQITGRTAAYRYKNQRGVEVRAIERALGARFLVTGTLRESGGRLVISAQLNDSMTRGEVWSDTFNRDPKDFGSVSGDIVRTITDTLRAHLGGDFDKRAPSVSTVGTTNSAALDLYLVGQELVKHRGSGIQQGAANFEQAISLDPKFARAYAALATALEYYPYFLGTPPAEIQNRAINAANRALELDSTLADAHTALGSVYTHSGRWGQAVTEFEHAVALEPDNVAAHLTYARFLALRGSVREALAHLEQARKLERVSGLVSAWTSYALFLDGRVDSALKESARAVELDSTQLAIANLAALLHLAVGQPDVARRLMPVAPPVVVMSYAPYVYAKVSDTAVAMRLIRTADANQPRPWFADVSRASVMLAMGDTAKALDALERSVAATGSLWVYYLPPGDPAYDPVRQSPRFAALLRQAGLDSRMITAPRGTQLHR
jgi:serine/threonine protein kinase/tetratricopeptide (TPR) repeat protein